jgi:peptidoglycan biosynthesis protein MviN/MurJ (putative lipid II flippase)
VRHIERHNIGKKWEKKFFQVRLHAENTDATMALSSIYLHNNVAGWRVPLLSLDVTCVCIVASLVVLFLPGLLRRSVSLPRILQSKWKRYSLCLLYLQAIYRVTHCGKVFRRTYRNVGKGVRR